MAAAAEEVKLHGFWASPYSQRVIWALKIKGVEYEYIEEDIFNNKSEMLLKYNPVYKRVPVMVHGGGCKPIPESLIILDYIEETWPQNPLLPTDSYEKALARFWIHFGETMEPFFRTFLLSSGEEQEKVTKELTEMLKILEEKALGDKRFFGGDEINMVDIAFGFMSYWLKNAEKVVGIKLVDPKSFPRFHEWAQNFINLPVIQGNIPDDDKMLAYLTNLRVMFIQNPQVPLIKG